MMVVVLVTSLVLAAIFAVAAVTKLTDRAVREKPLSPSAHLSGRRARSRWSCRSPS